MPLSIQDFVAATFTPITSDGQVNLEEIDHYQQFLDGQGVGHVYVNGSTGEGPSLTTKERKETTEAWLKACSLRGSNMKVLVQVGGTTAKETMELTEHAASLEGVYAVSTLPPLYYLPASVDELVEYCGEVSKRAPKIPLYYYHIPDKTGVRFSMDNFLIKCRSKVPMLRGIKFSSKDLFEGTKCLRTRDAGGDFYDLLFGSDEQVLAALAMGFQGAIGSTYNLMPRAYQRMKSEFQAGRVNQARELQHLSVDLVKTLFSFGSGTGGPLPAMKATLSELGVNVGPPRYPMLPLEDPAKCQLKLELQQLDFFNKRK